MTSLEVEIAERLLTHLREGTADSAASDLRIPAWYYFDEGQAARERALFFRTPLVATVSSALTDAGSFVTLDLIGVPLLLVRQDDGTLAGFRNVCRHRGGPVEQEACGTRRVFTCRYHGWTYNRDGDLRHVPYAEGFDSVEPACHGLVRIGVAERHGLVFVTLGSTEPPDVAAWLGPEFDAQLAELGLGTWSLHVDERFTQPVNWKLVADGLMDILHPKFLHPDSVGKLILTHTHTFDRHGRHARLAMARHKLDRFKDDDVPDGADLRRYVITNFILYPNTMLVSQPDHFELWSVFPDADSPQRCTTSIRFLVPNPPDDTERARLDQSWEILRDAVTGEDWPMAEAIQKAANSSGTPEPIEFVYGRDEVPLQHLHRHLAVDLGDDGWPGTVKPFPTTR
jgi:phenylpropionate dioxygenase-like ring-hydroxylating dioxygenase large terminal subunit